MVCPSRLVAEGRIAVVTTREAGMRWTRTCCPTSGTKADDEIVWSWRAHARAKSVARPQRSRMDDGGKSWFTEEITYKA